MLIDGLKITILINPILVKPGTYIRKRDVTTGFIYMFNNDADRLAWLDVMDEQIFELNHPKRPS